MIFENDEKKEEPGFRESLQKKCETFTKGMRAFLGRDPVKRTIENSIDEFVTKNRPI